MHIDGMGLSRSQSVQDLNESAEQGFEAATRWERILGARTTDGFSFVTRLQESLDRRRMGAPRQELDDAQVQAIEDYVSESYAYVNDYLAARANPQPVCRYGPGGRNLIRERPPRQPSGSADCYEERARTLRGALEGLPSPQGAVLYKGSLRSVELAEALERGAVRRGDCLTNVSFLSASESPFCVGSFATDSDGKVPPLGVIFVFTGHQSFRTISPHSGNPVECEALCPPGASFVITEATPVATATKGRFWLVTLNEAAAGARPDRDLFGRRVARGFTASPAGTATDD